MSFVNLCFVLSISFRIGTPCSPVVEPLAQVDERLLTVAPKTVTFQQGRIRLPAGIAYRFERRPSGSSALQIFFPESKFYNLEVLRTRTSKDRGELLVLAKYVMSDYRKSDLKRKDSINVTPVLQSQEGRWTGFYVEHADRIDGIKYCDRVGVRVSNSRGKQHGLVYYEMHLPSTGTKGHTDWLKAFKKLLDNVEFDPPASG